MNKKQRKLIRQKCDWLFKGERECEGKCNRCELGKEMFKMTRRNK